MKILRIDFVETSRWLVVWVPTFFAIGAVIGAVYIKDRSWQTSIDATKSQSVQLRVQERALKDAVTKTATQAMEPRIAQLDGIRQKMRLDWNPAFATIENLQEPGTRLLLLRFDAASQTIGLEYEVQSIRQAIALTTAMNAGYATAPWKLEGATGVELAAPKGSDRMRATWTTRLSDLR